MDPVQWTEDGWFTINNGKGPSLVQEAPDLPQVVFERNLFDDFDTEALNLEWEFVRNPDNGSWSLTERPGHFRIWTRDGQLNEIRAKNTLLIITIIVIQKRLPCAQRYIDARCIHCFAMKSFMNRRALQAKRKADIRKGCTEFFRIHF